MIDYRGVMNDLCFGTYDDIDIINRNLSPMTDENEVAALIKAVRSLRNMPKPELIRVRNEVAHHDE